MATDPADPDADSAETVATSSVPTTVTVAESTSECASISTQLGTIAWLSTFEMVSATAAPTAALVPSVAEPSAFDAASELALEARVTVPPAVRCSTSVVSRASATTVEMTMATAAATDTRPSEVEALGDCLVPEPDEPWRVETLSP